MPKWIKVFTHAGLALLADAPGKKLSFTKAVCGSGSVPVSALPGLTDVPGKEKELPITSGASSGDTHKLRLQLSNTGVVASFPLKMIGIFASLDDGVDTLLLVMQTSVPDVIHSEMESPGFVSDYVVNITLSNADNVTVNLDNNAYVTVGEKAVPGGVATLDANGKIPPEQMAGQQQIPDASTTVKGIVQLDDTITSTSTSLAATANSVRIAHALANNAIPKSDRGIAGGVATLGSDGMVTPEQLPPAQVLQNASLTVPGIVKLNNTVNSTSNTEAATPSAVRTAYNLANSASSTANNAIPKTDKGKANGVASLGSDGKVPAAQLPAAQSVPNASTSVRGIVQLSYSVSNPDNTVAATSSAVMQTYNLANSANSTANSAYNIAVNAISKTEKGKASGVASLDANGKVPAAQMPYVIGNYIGASSVHASSTARLINLGFTPSKVDILSASHTPSPPYHYESVLIPGHTVSNIGIKTNGFNVMNHVISGLSLCLDGQGVKYSYIAYR